MYAGLELAPLPPPQLSSASASINHSNARNRPVLLTFCTQIHVGSPFTDFTYKEFILTVPYVQWDDAHAPRFPNYRGPFAYLPHLYLNETEPVDLGHAYVGDRKEFAYIMLNSTSTQHAGESVEHGALKMTGVTDSHWDPNSTGAKATGAFPQQRILSAEWSTTQGCAHDHSCTSAPL